jgi:formylmethanofuran dehydrogenase subunit D
MPLFAILKALADALDVEAPASPAAALDAMAASNPIYQPAADLLVGEGVKLTIAPTGKGTAAAVAAAAVDGDGIRVIASRDLYTAEDAAALRHPEAERLHRYDRIQVSEADATRLSIRDGDEIELSSGSWTLRAPATVTERLPAGAVFVSSLMQGGAVAKLFTGASLPTVKVGALTPA